MAVSRAIFTSVSNFLIGQAIDNRLITMRAQLVEAKAAMNKLDGFDHGFRGRELQRASFVLGLVAGNTDGRLRYTLDRPYRVSAAGSLRRIAAIVYPGDW